jgi:RimJ/RimL family protein N-acetyltransferase
VIVLNRTLAGKNRIINSNATVAAVLIRLHAGPGPLVMADRSELQTKRLVLRPFTSGDAADALAYRNDEEFARFLTHIPLPFTRQDSEAFVRGNMSDPWDTSPTFAVVLDGKVIGTVNLEVNPQTRTAMLGYAIGQAWRGQGIATEAARAVVTWGAKRSASRGFGRRPISGMSDRNESWRSWECSANRSILGTTWAVTGNGSMKWFMDSISLANDASWCSITPQ